MLRHVGPSRKGAVMDSTAIRRCRLAWFELFLPLVLCKLTALLWVS